MTLTPRFRKKTAPAFHVALQLGALSAGSADDLEAVFARYSESLGIAYQIRGAKRVRGGTHGRQR